MAQQKFGCDSSAHVVAMNVPVRAVPPFSRGAQSTAGGLFRRFRRQLTQRVRHLGTDHSVPLKQRSMSHVT